jgi:hypothetical protein
MPRLLRSLTTLLLPSVAPPVTPPAPPTSCGEWQVAAVGTDWEAAELLELAEADGYTERQVLIAGDSSFIVRWR